MKTITVTRNISNQTPHRPASAWWFGRLLFAGLLAALWMSPRCLAATRVVAWGSNVSGQTNVPSGLTDVVAISAGHSSGLALKSDGTVVGWPTNGQIAAVPTGLTNVVAIAAGGDHGLALQPNGTVVGWGNDFYSQATPPANLTNVAAIVAGEARSMVLRSNGTVVAWGYGDSDPNFNVPAGLANVKAIVLGYNHLHLAVMSNGTVRTWGGIDICGETTVPAGLAEVKAVASGSSFTLALLSNGTVRAWGCTVVPPDLQDVVAIAAGVQHSLALKSDGTVVAWGSGLATDLALLRGLKVTAIAAGASHSMALLGESAPVFLTPTIAYTVYTGTSLVLSAGAVGVPEPSYQWMRDGFELSGATNATLALNGIRPSDAGSYWVLASNVVGTASNEIASLTVLTNILIQYQPRGYTVPAGEPWAFRVVLAGASPFLYQWRYNGNNISGATNALFLIPSVNPADAGVYDAVIQNPYGGMAISQAAPLMVSSPVHTNVAGLLFEDFDQGLPPEMNRFGVASLGPGGLGGSGVLKLMTNANYAFGDLVIDDFSRGAPVAGFLVTFDLLMGGGTTVPADGFSFNYGTNFYRPADYFGPPRREDGFTNGLTVAFDSWDSGTEGGNPDDTAPAIEAKVFGRQLAFQSMDGQRLFRQGVRSPAGPLLTDPLTGQPMTLETEPPAGQGPMTNFARVVIEMDRNGALWVTYKGLPVINGVQTGIPIIAGGKFAFTARTGAATENIWIDNLEIRVFSDPLPVSFLTSNPTGQYVTNGTPATFQADLFGSSPISIQWFSNDVAIAGATNASHTTASATFANVGDVYRVEASNAYGSTNRSATLYIKQAPVIVQSPQAQTVTAGNDVTFTVTVTNNASLPIGYQWRKGSTPLTNIVLNSRTCSFTLFNVATNVTTTNGPGSYRVVITNAGNTLPGILGQATLTVLPATAPTATTLAASGPTTNGATLNASINPKGAQTVAWFDYGLTATYGSRTDVVPVGNASNVVAFSHAVTALMSGTNYHYRVVATNHGGMALGADLVFQTTATVTPPTISAFELLPNGHFRLRFDSAPGLSFSVLVSTNLTDWTPLGPAVELTPGHFEFTDAEAPGHPTRFYQLRSP